MPGSSDSSANESVPSILLHGIGTLRLRPRRSHVHVGYWSLLSCSVVTTWTCFKRLMSRLNPKRPYYLRRRDLRSPLPRELYHRKVCQRRNHPSQQGGLLRASGACCLGLRCRRIFRTRQSAYGSPPGGQFVCVQFQRGHGRKAISRCTFPQLLLNG